MKILILLIMTVAGITAAGVGCSNKAASNNNNSAASLNPGLAFQSPSIDGILTPMGSSSASSITNLLGSSYSINAVTSPATLTLDLSKSTAPSGTAISANVAIASGGTVTSLGGMKYTLNFPNPILGAVTITLTDALGLQSKVSFNVPVTCDPNKLTNGPITFSGSPISVTAAASAGFVNVSVAAPTGGSGSGFMYALDINGDGRFDDQNKTYWSTTNSWQNVYTLYDGARNVKVTAIDSKCQVEQSVTQSVNFANILPAMQTGGTAQVESYYYLQGQVDPATTSADPADTVHSYDAMDDGAQGNHVKCNYNYGSNGQGNLSIQSYNVYSDGGTSSVEASMAQQMVLGFNVPADTGGVGTVNQGSTPVSTLTYQTAQSPDGNYSGSLYNKDNTANCTATAKIVKTPSQGTCATAPSNQVMMIQMTGTYSCSSLSTGGTTSKSVKVTNGYFYCQYDTAQNCVGSGQEGGNPPPAF
jgi:hypothetical protein